MRDKNRIKINNKSPEENRLVINIKGIRYLFWVLIIEDNAIETGI
jgi:hypothetical protein